LFVGWNKNEQNGGANDRQENKNDLWPLIGSPRWPLFSQKHLNEGYSGVVGMERVVGGILWGTVLGTTSKLG
jgi:hypothetical protein